MEGPRVPYLDSYSLRRIVETTDLLNPVEQGDDLILWVGSLNPDAGLERKGEAQRELSARLGARSQEGAEHVLKELAKLGLIDR